MNLLRVGKWILKVWEFLSTYKDSVLRVIGALSLSKIEKAIEVIGKVRETGGTIFVCGNGGSASTASHFACDLLKSASYGRDRRFKIICLNDSIPTLTAYSNDVGYAEVFAEQLKNLAQPGDLFLTISGSGNSPNVLKGMGVAKELGLQTIALTGRDGGKLGPLAELEINANEPHMGRIEDAHMVICHMICYYFIDTQ